MQLDLIKNKVQASELRLKLARAQARSQGSGRSRSDKGSTKTSQKPQRFDLRTPPASDHPRVFHAQHDRLDAREPAGDEPVAVPPAKRPVPLSAQALRAHTQQQQKQMRSSSSAASGSQSVEIDPQSVATPVGGARGTGQSALGTAVPVLVVPNPNTEGLTPSNSGLRSASVECHGPDQEELHKAAQRLLETQAAAAIHDVRAQAQVAEVRVQAGAQHEVMSARHQAEVHQHALEERRRKGVTPTDPGATRPSSRQLVAWETPRTTAK